MKGTEVDNRRRLRQLSSGTKESREVAKLMAEDKLEVKDGELILKPEYRPSAVKVEPIQRLPEDRWE